MIHADLIGTICPRVSDKKIAEMTEVSFWERIGFSSSTKREIMIVQGKEQLEQSYHWLKSTVVQSRQLDELFQQKKDTIASLETE